MLFVWVNLFAWWYNINPSVLYVFPVHHLWEMVQVCSTAVLDIANL